jgi:hypothetical protein
MVHSLDAGDAVCPACASTQHDLRLIIRNHECEHCGHVFQLTTRDRGRTILCSQCHSLLGCLVPHERYLPQRVGRTPLRPFKLLDASVLSIAFAFGYAAMLQVSAATLLPGAWLHGLSIVALCLTWAVVVLRITGHPVPRGRLFRPAGVAACLVVAVASVLAPFCIPEPIAAARYSSLDLIAELALRASRSGPLGLTVVALWMLQVMDGKWRSERSWIDLLGRALGLYWILAGLGQRLLLLM